MDAGSANRHGNDGKPMTLAVSRVEACAGTEWLREIIGQLIWSRSGAVRDDYTGALRRTVGLPMNVDIAIVGGGPIGLSLARAVSGQGLSVAVLDPQSGPALAEPAFDGREIALTHASRRWLSELGVWQQLDADEISPLRHAHVSTGGSRSALEVTARDGGQRELGWLVPNHLIRRAAYRVASGCADVTLLSGVAAEAVQGDRDGVEVVMSDQRRLRARLMIAADSRFSRTRRLLGIGARSRDFGKTMLVCRVEHDRPHDHIARECFGLGQTLALLPLNGQRSSVVLTLPPPQVGALMALDDDAFCAELTRRSEERLGVLRRPGSRHAYPLVGVYADRFIGHRAALAGDAAVGMHPVTAHGFNLGLLGIERLASEVSGAYRRTGDPADPAALARYEFHHRLASRPLYLATGLVVSVYTDDRGPARLLRGAALRLVQAVTPFRRALASRLTQA